MLGPASCVRPDPNRAQLTVENLFDVIDVGFALLALARNLLDDLLVLLRVQLREGEVLQFPLDVPHAEAVGQRGVNIERLLRHGTPAHLRQKVDRPHVVEPVGQLHQHHPDVFRHRDQHLADVFRLGLLLTVEADFLQLGHAGDQLAHGGPEALFQIGDRQMRVFDGVVQDGGRQRVTIQLQVGEDARHAQGVLDELLTRETVLVIVGARGSVIGTGEDLHVLGR